MAEQEKAAFCPDCGSPTVDISLLLATCRKCGWKGKAEELLQYSFSHGMGSKEDILSVFARDVQLLFAKKQGVPILQLLLKWGFMAEPDPKLFAVYLRAIGKAVFKAIVLTREELLAKQQPTERPS